MLTFIVYSIFTSTLLIYIYGQQEKEALKQKEGITFYGIPLQEDEAYDDCYDDDYDYDSILTDELWAEQMGIDIPSSDGIEEDEYQEAEDWYERVVSNRAKRHTSVWTQEEMMPDYESYLNSQMHEDVMATKRTLTEAGVAVPTDKFLVDLHHPNATWTYKPESEEEYEKYLDGDTSWLRECHQCTEPDLSDAIETDMQFREVYGIRATYSCAKCDAEEVTVEGTVCTKCEPIEHDPESAYAKAMRMTIRQLKAIASALGIKGYGDMTKHLLALAIVSTGYQFTA